MIIIGLLSFALETTESKEKVEQACEDRELYTGGDRSDESHCEPGTTVNRWK